MIFAKNGLSRCIRFSCAMPVFLGLCFSIPGHAHVSDRGWEIETIDAPRIFDEMSDRSLCFDNQGNPHIAFGKDHIHHAWLEGDVWMIETVDQSPGVGEEATIAIDPSGGIHIAYYDRINDALKYAYGGGNGWYIETVDPAGGHFPSVVTDDMGRPHIAYNPDDLNYAVKTSAGWEIFEVETDVSPGTFASLDLDADGYAHIGHYDSIEDELLYTYEDESGWHTELVDDSSYDTGWHPSLVVDSDGIPHISYYNRGIRSASYAVRMESGWQIDTLGERGNWTSLTLGETGTPHMVFCGTDEILYARKDGSEWMIEELDAYARCASIALDGNGDPVFSFIQDIYSEGVVQLEYAQKRQGVWELETVTTAGDVGTYSAMAKDDSDRLHICYVNSSSRRIRYAVSGDRGWSLAELDLMGIDLDLAVDDEGYPHISYLDEEDDAVIYLYHNGQEWRVETVENDIVSDAYTSITLDGSGIPHLAYRDFRVLHYAVKSDTGWVVEILGPEGEHTSIAVDGQDNPHIGYHSWGDRMGYAYRDGSEWRFESADMAGEGGFYNSMVLDDAGYPHMTYFDNLPDDIRYAYKDVTGWHVELIDEEWDVGKYTSLALDSSGNPRVSYFYGMDVDLRFGYREDDVWHTYTVTGEGRVGGWSQLVLDSQDLPHVVYYSESAGDLMYAYSDAVGVTENGPIAAISGSIRFIEVSPMPVRMNATVIYHFDHAASDALYPVHLELYDCMGRRIRSWSYEQPPGECRASLRLPSVDLGGPVSGVYYLKAAVENGSGEDIQPVIVIR